MNGTFKTVSAVALLAFGSANAFAASDDGVIAGKGTGTGAGDLMFAYEAADGLSSILWDLAIFNGSTVADDLTVGSILNGPNKGGFSITNAAVSSFVTNNPGGRWNIFGLTNTKSSGTTLSNMRYDQAGYVLTINGEPQTSPLPSTGNTGGKIEALMVNNANWIARANEGGLPDNGTLTAGPADLFQFSSGGLHSEFIASQDATGRVGDTLSVWTIFVDNTMTRGFGASSGAQGAAPMVNPVTSSGVPMAFTFAADGTLSYSPVPVPGAVWLMGSAIAGVAAMRRRRA